MPDVQIVIVTYGERRSLLDRVLSRLVNDPDISTIHIVSNNAKYELPEHEKLKPLRLPENTGSANGYKMGIQQAVENGAEFIWLLDDDNQPAEDALGQLLKQYNTLGRVSPSNQTCLAVTSVRPGRQMANITRGQSAGFLGFQVSDMGRKLRRRLGLGLGLDFGDVAGSTEALTRPAEINSCPYGGMLFTPHLVDVIGLPNSDFVLYADDIEYTSRIQDRGGVLYMIPDAMIDDLDQSWNIGQSAQSNLAMWLETPGDFRAFYSARNLAFLEQQQAGNSVMFRINRFVYIAFLASYAVFFRKTHRFRILLDAFRDARQAKLGINKRFPLA